MLCLFGCKKKEKEYSVTFEGYAMNTPVKFYYQSKEVLYDEIITTNNFTKTITVTDNDFERPMGLTNVNTSAVDSLHIKAIIDGKTVQLGYKFTGGYANVDIQLIQAQ